MSQNTVYEKFLGFPGSILCIHAQNLTLISILNCRLLHLSQFVRASSVTVKFGNTASKETTTSSILRYLHAVTINDYSHPHIPAQLSLHLLVRLRDTENLNSLKLLYEFLKLFLLENTGASPVTGDT